MTMIDYRDIVRLLLVCVLIAGSPGILRGQQLPYSLGDEEYWRIVNEFSEADGPFDSDNFVSNEAGYQSVLPRLLQTVRSGGVYIGVGPEQNFTYIAALQPKIAFIVDIRRQNLLQHLMYKALFELSSERPTFSCAYSREPARPGWMLRQVRPTCLPLMNGALPTSRCSSETCWPSRITWWMRISSHSRIVTATRSRMS
jgi:hypothetical protein